MERKMPTQTAFCQKPLVVSLEEAAYLLGVNKQLIAKLVTQGKIKSIRMGERRIVIPMKAIEQIVEEGLPE